MFIYWRIKFVPFYFQFVQTTNHTVGVTLKGFISCVNYKPLISYFRKFYYINVHIFFGDFSIRYHINFLLLLLLIKKSVSLLPVYNIADKNVLIGR